MSDARPTVLVGLGCFAPGHRVSGPNQSFARAGAALADQFRFRIVSIADPGERPDRWTKMDGLERIALAPGRPFARGFTRLLRETPHDLLICNGFFDRALTMPALLMHRLRRLPAPLLLAPRGEFTPGALGLKSGRKAAYVNLLRATGFLSGVSLQATGEGEASLLRNAFPANRVLIGPNIRTLPPVPTHTAPAPDGPLRVVFLSRIDRMKNLEFALDVLSKAGVPATLNIFGPQSDAAYWAECQARIATVSPSLSVRYHGAVAPEEVAATLARFDLFILPTQGENFGHAIVDALLSGTPALISDRTPWHGLAATCAGADLSLDDSAAWVAFVREMAGQSPTNRTAGRRAARHFVEQRINLAGDTAQLALCINAALDGPRSAAKNR